MFRSVAANGDERGLVEMNAATLAQAANFFDSVVNELLGVIGDQEVPPVEPR